jgi:hypothetical protein
VRNVALDPGPLSLLLLNSLVPFQDLFNQLNLPREPSLRVGEKLLQAILVYGPMELWMTR